MSQLGEPQKQGYRIILGESEIKGRSWEGECCKARDQEFDLELCQARTVKSGMENKTNRSLPSQSAQSRLVQEEDHLRTNLDNMWQGPLDLY